MRKLFYILIGASLICSCGSHKSTLKQVMNVEQRDSTRKDFNLGYTSTQDIITLLKSTKDRKITWKVYDTGRPKDSDTGKYPLLAEGNTSESAETEQGFCLQSEDSIKLDASTSILSNQKSNSEKEFEKQNEETAIPKQISSIVWGLAALAFSLLIGIIGSKWKKWTDPKKRP